MIVKNKVLGFLLFSLFFMSLSSVSQAQQKACRRAFTTGVKKNSSIYEEAQSLAQSDYEEAQSLAQSEEVKTQEEYQADSNSLGQPSTPNTSYVGRWQDIVKLFEGTEGTATKEFPSYEEAQSLAQEARIKTWAEYRANYKSLRLPSNPNKIYKESWQGWGHFLGTGRTRTKKFPSYEEAQSLVQELGVTTMREYLANYKRLRLPSNPNQSYKASWQDWGHFLGTGRTGTKEFPSYEEAQSLVQSAGIKTNKEYRANYKSLRLPSNPNKIYKASWQGYGHFLGIERTKTKEFPSYEEAQSLVQSAGIKTAVEYRANYKSLKLPSAPDQSYKASWQGYGHFLGIERTGTKEFPSYEEAQNLVQSAGIKTAVEYNANYKNLRLPSTPNKIYKENWQGWGHFLGTGRARTTEFLSYEEAQNLVQSVGIKTKKEYQANYKNLRLPSAPHKIYKASWQGYGYFLGTGRTATKEFPSYEKAQSLVQSEGVKTNKEYRANYKSMGLPSDPDRNYKASWQGWGYFLGTGRTRITRITELPSYKKAQSLVQSEGVKTQKEYRANYKRLRLPSRPDISYKASWQDWGHFLGTGRTRTKKFPSYEKAKSLVQTEGIKTQLEYKANYKSLGLPSNPNKSYKASWQGWGHFFGTGRTRTKEFLSYEEAQSLVQTEGIKTQLEYRANYKRLGLPSNPKTSYKASWQGYGHFLGTGRTRTTEFPSYEEAQNLVQSEGIKTWAKYNASYKKLRLPSAPHQIYKESWQSWGHFLGTGRTRTKK